MLLSEVDGERIRECDLGKGEQSVVPIHIPWLRVLSYR
jgi:hypothetical protein